MAARYRARQVLFPASEDFRHNSDQCGASARTPETQRRLQAALSNGFQDREAELALGRLLAELAVPEGSVR
jgi:hypothetical protein